MADRDAFLRAGRLDGHQQPAEEVAKVGFEAMMSGDANVIAGWKNKLEALVSNVIPAEKLAEQHRKMAEPGSADSRH